ncbi:MAG: twin transmembrane helix small protein [Nitrosospira sp.]|nr:twin transmembrane helix small protein [Nitrosospira sp.]MDW7642964.1 twin transmembrane helix small protein [Nitrosomonadaceae bacterium]MBI0407805.1 twin transmembrane helix small protein [Nitrosospira sp.]MBI0415053.1 twin transmembrane helix small protein [Nitrosospira sp.]MBI0415238.1 twin transmembrane helix small protein [Nitrosospira sp.]
MKTIAALFFIFILFSLISALYYMVKDKGEGTRMLKSLTLRIGLSIVLFLMLMLGYYLGIVPGKQ